jgi:hypothetical protein
VDAAPRENCSQQKKRPEKDDELRRNIQSSPVRVDWFPAQDLPVSVYGGEGSGKEVSYVVNWEAYRLEKWHSVLRYHRGFGLS